MKTIHGCFVQRLLTISRTYLRIRGSHILVALGTLLTMWSAVSVAAPLPAGTKLSVTAGTGSGFNQRCTVGSCFGMETAPGLVYWNDVTPGLDGGIIIGKQQSVWPGPIIPELDPCELAVITPQGGLVGCFVTAPAAETNIFDSASCDGTGCLGKTEIKSLSLTGVGSLSGACPGGGNCPGVQKWAVTASAYSLDYAWTTPDGPYAGFKTYLHMAGDIQPSGNLPPVAIISPSTILVVPPGISITLDGSQSYDPDGTIVCHNWEIPGVILPAVCDPKVSFSTPSTPQTLTVKLTVTDNLGAQGSSVTSVVVAYEVPPYAGDVNVSGESGQIIFWKPLIAGGYSSNCSLTSPPANGTATVAGDCSMGTYQSNAGFVGTDRFGYWANGGRVGTVSVAVTEPPPSDQCLAQYLVSQFTQTGKEGTMNITFTGNITSHTNKEVKVCPGTTLSYKTTSTRGPVVCKVKNNTTAGIGFLRINDHIKCTDKPAGKDKVQFKVKSGVAK